MEFGSTGKDPEFAPNKKWAVSPLISPPAGELTANAADKLVATTEYGESPGISTCKAVGCCLGCRVACHHREIPEMHGKSNHKL